MGSKLNIQIDQNQNYRVFVDGVEIATIHEGKTSLIDSIRVSSNNDENGEAKSHVEIVFQNRLGGLFEAEHKEIISSMTQAVKALKGLPVELSMRWQLGLKSTNDEEAWLEKYGPMRGVSEIMEKI